MSLGTPIATGFTAEIFPWKNGQVLKLFNPGIPRQVVEWEAHLAGLVYEHGLPVPSLGGVVEADGRFGLEYERVTGVSMLEALVMRPWKFVGYARLLAQLQVQVNRISLPDMPSNRQRLERKIRRAEILPENVREAALTALEGLPEQDGLCHGDFHPGNILLAERGPVIIDWIDAARGNPILDIARSTIIFSGIHLPASFPGGRVLNLVLKWFYPAYLKRYLELNPFDPLELDRWLPVVAAVRLDENITFDEKRLLSIAMRLLPKS